MTTSPKRPARKAKAKPLTADQRKIKELEATIEKARDEYRTLQYENRRLTESKEKSDANGKNLQDYADSVSRQLSSVKDAVAMSLQHTHAVGDNVSNSQTLQRVLGQVQGLMLSIASPLGIYPVHVNGCDDGKAVEIERHLRRKRGY